MFDFLSMILDWLHNILQFGFTRDSNVNATVFTNTDEQTGTDTNVNPNINPNIILILMSTIKIDSIN